MYLQTFKPSNLKLSNHHTFQLKTQHFNTQNFYAMQTFHKPIPILSLFAMLLLFVWACRKEKPEFDLSDKDPCGCASEVSADFDIFELITTAVSSPGNVAVLTDHITNGQILFSAKLNGATYKWYIGSEILTEQTIQRGFGSQWWGYDIPVSLVVQKEPNKICFPNDDGYDSITKSFHVYSKCDADWYEGDFRFAYPNSTDSFDVRFEFHEIMMNNLIVPNSCFRLEFYNYDGAGSNCVDSYFTVVNRGYRFFGSSNLPHESCNYLRVNSFYRDFNDVVHIDYEYLGVTEVIRTKGRKL